MENAAKDGGVVKSGSQESLKKNTSSRPIDSGVDSGLYTSDTDSNSRSLSSHNSAERLDGTSVSGASSISNHKAIHSNSQLHCSSSLSTTRHVHSGARQSLSSIDSSVRLSSSIHSSDSGFSDKSGKRRTSLSDHEAPDVPDYYPLFSRVIHRQRNSSGFPVNSKLLIMDYCNYQQVTFHSANETAKPFGIEIYHNAPSPLQLLPTSPINEQLSAAVSIFQKATRKVKSMKDVKIDQLHKLQILGRGGYAHVELMRDTDGATYALKCINKSRVVAAGQRRHVKAEREILLDIDSQFILKLYKTFRDKKYVYLLTEALLGGELFTLMKRTGPLDETKAVFALACVLEAIDYLHGSNVSF